MSSSPTKGSEGESTTLSANVPEAQVKEFDVPSQSDDGKKVSKGAANGSSESGFPHDSHLGTSSNSIKDATVNTDSTTSKADERISSENNGSRKRERSSTKRRDRKGSAKALKVELTASERLTFLESIRDPVRSIVRNHAGSIQEAKSEYILTRSRPPLFWKPNNFTSKLSTLLDRQRNSIKNETSSRLDKYDRSFSSAVRSLQPTPPTRTECATSQQTTQNS